MLKQIGKLLNNQKSLRLTLIELLDLVVNMRIIATIDVPNSGSLVGNLKKDSYITNSLKSMVTADDEITVNFPSNSALAYLSKLLRENYIESVKNPSGTFYGINGIRHSYNLLLFNDYISKVDINGKNSFSMKISDESLY